MLSFQEYISYDGLGLGQLVNNKEISISDLREVALFAIEKINPQINAVLYITPIENTTIDTALSLNPLFNGVPFLIKELVLEAENIPCRMGSHLSKDVMGIKDSELMQRFRRAGLSLIGTTPTPELGVNVTTEPVLTGAVLNPWDITKSPGGSSGGSAAAVAAGIVPIAHANDGGGSIRIPASCNGLVGLKPSRDRVPTGPHYSDPLCGLGIEFAVTRSVRDTAALLDLVSGIDIGAPSLIPSPTHSFQSAANQPIKPLRIGWSVNSPAGKPIDAECKNAVYQSVKLLEEMGHHLIECEPTYSWQHFIDGLTVIWTTYVASAVSDLSLHLRRDPLENLENITALLYEEGKQYLAMDLLQAMHMCNEVSRSTGHFYANIDVHLTPSLAYEPANLGVLNQNAKLTSSKDWVHRIFEYAPFSSLYNVTGQPAISLPLYWTKKGLPIGVQLASRLGEERQLLQLAFQLEATLPWFHKRPAMCSEIYRQQLAS